MTPSTTARPTIVRTMLPPVLALWVAVVVASAASVFTGAFSKSLPAAKATGALRRQPKTAAGREAWRIRINNRGGLSRDQAQGSYRQLGSRPEVGLRTNALRPPVRCARA